MRGYEVVVVLHPELEDVALKENIDKVQGWITEAGGSIGKVDVWGKRKLAYPLRKQKEGQYVLIQAQMEPKVTAPLERNLRFLEPVMRFLIIAQD